jgi:hypothetical protein
MNPSFDQQYYYFDGRDRHGPFSRAQINSMIASLSIRPDSYLAPAGGEWALAAVLFPDSFLTTPGRKGQPEPKRDPELEQEPESQEPAYPENDHSSLRDALAEMIAVRPDIEKAPVGQEIRRIFTRARNWVLVFVGAFMTSMLVRYAADKFMNSH